MGGIINGIIGIIAAVILYRTQHTITFGMCILSTGANIWSSGIMHNYAMELAKDRVDRLKWNMEYEGRSAEEIKRLDHIIIRPSTREIASVPNWLSWINMISAFFNVAFLIFGIAD